jgi:hypothetical protein
LAVALLAKPPELGERAGLRQPLTEAKEGLLPLEPKPAGAVVKRGVLAAHQLTEGGEGQLLGFGVRWQFGHQQ